MTEPVGGPERPLDWSVVAGRVRAQGLRWTAQRRTVLEVMARTSGHVTASELVERCRTVDPGTTPSTVYRTLAVLEELGYVRHHHGMDGREEFHVLPGEAHGHLHCASCGGSWEIHAAEADAIAGLFGSGRRFAVDRSHITIVGRCRHCQETSGDTAEPKGRA